MKNCHWNCVDGYCLSFNAGYNESKCKYVPMKTTNVYIRSGVVCAVTEELPKEPIKEYFQPQDTDIVFPFDQEGYDDALRDYESALQRIKGNAAWDFLWRHDGDINSPVSLWYYRNTLGYKHEDKIKTLTASVEVEIIPGLCKYCYKDKGGHYHDTILNRYACKAGEMIAALCTYEPIQLARIVEEPEEKKVVICPSCKRIFVEPIPDKCACGQTKYFFENTHSTNAVNAEPVNSEVEDQEELTEKRFCELYTGFYGEEIDCVAQLVRATFTGEELMEFVQHCIARKVN